MQTCLKIFEKLQCSCNGLNCFGTTGISYVCERKKFIAYPYLQALRLAYVFNIK